MSSNHFRVKTANYKIKENNGHLDSLFFTYGSADNFLSPIPVFDWLIFCCRNLILHQKRNENDKNKFFDEKQQKMPKEVYVKTLSSILYSEQAPLTCDVTCSKL